MKTVTNLLDSLPIDNKLLTSFLSLALTRVAVGLLGVNAGDELLAMGLPVLVAAIVGYRTSNEGTVLRGAGLEDGEPIIPDDEAVPSEDVPPGGEVVV